MLLLTFDLSVTRRHGHPVVGSRSLARRGHTHVDGTTKDLKIVRDNTEHSKFADQAELLCLLSNRSPGSHPRMESV